MTRQQQRTAAIAAAMIVHAGMETGVAIRLAPFVHNTLRLRGLVSLQELGLPVPALQAILRAYEK